MNNNLQLLLKNYKILVDRVDDHIRQVDKQYSDSIVCRKGCDSCCRYLSLFPVEAFALANDFKYLTDSKKQIVINNIDDQTGNCPLLTDSQCVLYTSRPIICRTHGFPIFMKKDGEPIIDFCPKNFIGITDFPQHVLLDIEQLNATLTAINSLFIQSVDSGAGLPERISVSDAVFLLDD